MSGNSPKLIVLDVRLPFRKDEDLEARPNENEAFHSRIEVAKKDRKVSAALAQLITDHGADGIWLQAHRQDPQHPFVHAKPHLARTLDNKPGGPSREPDQGSGKSGQVVITAHFPEREKPWTDDDLAKSTVHLLDHIAALGWIHDHCRDRGYRTLNARGESYSDLDAVRHNSFMLVIASAVVVEVITLVQAVVIWILMEPTISSITPTSSVGRTTVTVDGTNFESGMTVTFNGFPVAHTLVSNSRFTTDLLPPSDSRTLISLDVLFPTISPIAVATSIGSVTSASSFSLLPPGPTITGFVPQSAAAGTPVDISGTNLNVSGLGVTFNGISANVSVVSGTAIRATVPPGAAVGSIEIVTAGGTARSATNFTEL